MASLLNTLLDNTKSMLPHQLAVLGLGTARPSGCREAGLRLLLPAGAGGEGPLHLQRLQPLLLEVARHVDQSQGRQWRQQGLSQTWT